jgi:D-alanyl-D-alanine carboxypeptidase/D-alanyl-D-alanine-endopeptidase (penicillin-binding protein 4)
MSKRSSASIKLAGVRGARARTLAGYADTSKHGRLRFVIGLTSNDGAMRFRLLKAIRSEL